MAKREKPKKTKLPDFTEMTDTEIAEFWRTHDVSEFWSVMEPVREKFRDARPKKAISMRMDEEALNGLKRLARQKGLGYQTLMRMWIKERLEKELSEPA
jgi:predicted DNA binding CopG/RHH family protein